MSLDYVTAEPVMPSRTYQPIHTTGRRLGLIRYTDAAADVVDRVVTLTAPELPAEHIRDFEALTGKFMRWPQIEVLESLSLDVGMSWTGVSRAVKVSIPAIRKWRKGGSITPINQEALARLLAACMQLQELGVASPAEWLERRLWPDVPVAPVDLLAAGMGAQVLDLAADRIDAVELLDSFDPAWRQKYAAQSSGVVFDEHGSPTTHVGARG